MVEIAKFEKWKWDIFGDFQTLCEGITCIGDFIGDGICDDSLNQKVCDYDNGDCCYHAIDKSNCFDCFCYADNSYPPELVNSKHFGLLTMFKKSIFSSKFQVTEKLRKIGKLRFGAKIDYF